MANYTKNYNLKKPSPEDFVDIADINSNMDVIDEALQGCKTAVGACYCVCNTAAATREKVATVIRGNFKLEAGVAVDVKFSEDNKITMPSLNVNGTGAKSIKMYSIIGAESYMWQAGAVVRFVYDGQYWQMLNGTQATTTYYGVTKLSSSVSSTAANLAATPLAVKQAYDLADAAVPKSQKGIANGVATLDADGKVLMSQIPEEVALAEHNHEVATTSRDGFMSKEQIMQLSIVEEELQRLSTKVTGAHSMGMTFEDFIMKGVVI
ncbi:MAG: hypothetical protein HFI72_05045 [Peptococcaceae bacterium]|nr:hypothetical protein [Peptococcaceae bacterium]